MRIAGRRAAERPEAALVDASDVTGFTPVTALHPARKAESQLCKRMAAFPNPG